MLHRAVFSAVIVLAASGCFTAPLPMHALHTDYTGAGSPRCLIVFFPGVGDSASSFAKQGLVRTVQQSGLAIDVVASDATFGYYTRDLMPKQVYTDVIEPARARKHYEQTWTVGVSFGGFGALLTAREYPNEIDGAFAIAPYLGRAEVLRSVRDAGGLRTWTAPAAAPTNSDNYDWQMWRFLKQASATQSDPKTAQLHLGWGKDDRLGEADQLVAQALPEQNVYSTPGAHEWDAWDRLLSQFLRRGPLAKACRAAPR